MKTFLIGFAVIALTAIFLSVCKKLWSVHHFAHNPDKNPILATYPQKLSIHERDAEIAAINGQIEGKIQR